MHQLPKVLGEGRLEVDSIWNKTNDKDNLEQDFPKDSLNLEPPDQSISLLTKQITEELTKLIPKMIQNLCPQMKGFQ